MDEYEIAQLAWKLERVDCGFAGEAQDQYAATFGGVNFMEFMPSGRVLVNPLRVKKSILNEFESSLMLYFSGISRASEKIIRSQSANAEKHDPDAIKAMLEIKQEAYTMKAGLLTGDFRLLVESFKKGWESKKRMSSEISTSHIDLLFEDAMAAGAEAGKISGAGGFMMLMVPPHARNQVISPLKQHGGDIFPAHFTHSSVEVWRRHKGPRKVAGTSAAS